MRIFGISGLGADKRVFDALTLDHDLIPVEWIDPFRNESIIDYSKRLSKVIDTQKPFCLMGVSFGGLVAVEIAKILNPELTIIISSAETKHELRPIFRFLGKTNLLRLIPQIFFDPPRGFAAYLFGAKNNILLNNILDDTDLKFAKWAVNELTTWKNVDKVKNIIKINGTKDKLIPPMGQSQRELVQKGEHFMIVDRADEISKIINDKINVHSYNA